MRTTIISVCLFISFNTLNAQNYKWANGIGNFSSDEGISITSDITGNVLVTGSFRNFLPTDFDPGIDTALLASAGGSDIFFAKYDSSGNYLWAKGIGGTGFDAGYSIVTDNIGNIFISGYFEDTVDFDPGLGTSILTGNGSTDIFFAKYDSSGNFLWAKGIGGSGSDASNSIVNDISGNVYISGWFTDSADFDPGVGTQIHSSVGCMDIFLAKYDSNGNYIWTMSTGGNNCDEGESIIIDGSGNVLLTGHFTDTADFDPGLGIANLVSAGGQDIFIAKYDSSGNYLWAQQLGGSSDDYGNCMTIDSELSGNNVIIVGFFRDTADFDPGIDTAQLVSLGGTDIFFAKFDSSGNYLWVKQLGGILTEYGLAIVADTNSPEENIFVTGRFYGTADFDPGPDTSTLISSGFEDIFFAKYDSAGNYIWVKQLGGPGFDNGNSIAVASNSNILLTGYFSNSADFDPGIGVQNLTSIGNKDIFFAKYSQSCISYSISDSSVTSCDSALIYGVFRTLSGTYFDSLTTIDGCDSIHSTVLSVNPTFAISDFAISICNGDSSLIYGNYQTIAGTYYDSLITINGCDSVHSTVLTANPTYGLSDPAIGICSSDSALIYGSYQITAGTYYDSLTTLAGCDSVRSTVLTVNPTYSINDPGTSICNGDSMLIYGAYSSIAGTYYDSLTTIDGCDSIHSTVLTVNPTYSLNDPALAICAGDSTQIYSTYQSATGIYYDSLTTINGCDSVYATVLTVNQVFSIADPVVNICTGDSALIYGTYRITAGTYYDSLTTIDGCDSLHYTVLIINQNYSASDPPVSMCTGDSMMIYGIYRTVSGAYYDSLMTIDGCDSILLTVLTVQPIYGVSTPDEMICEGDSIMLFGTFRNIAGTYYDSLSAVTGCDSVLSTALTVNLLSAVSFSGLDSVYCSIDAGVSMVGTPVGGSFSGTGGVAGTEFYPATGVNTYTVTYSYTDSLGCSNSTSQPVSVVQCPVIISVEEHNVENVKIFPNPNTGEFTISLTSESAQNFELKVFNNLGEQVSSEKVRLSKGFYEKRFNLNGRAAGIYNIQFIFEGETINRVIIIE